MDARASRPVFALPPSALALLAATALGGCVFVPRTTYIYDEECQIRARQMVLEVEQVGTFVGCRGDACAAVLAGVGVVAAASAVVSGSIVIAGNIVYWFEKQGNCLRREDLPPDYLPPPPYTAPPATMPPPPSPHS